MPPIDPAELSAFLDGELPPERREQVRAALAGDPALRQTYERLQALDAEWAGHAAAAAFRPRVQLEPEKAPSRILAAAAVLSLLALRLALKAPPPLIGVGLELTLLALVIGWGVRRIMRAGDADRERLALTTGF